MDNEKVYQAAGLLGFKNCSSIKLENYILYFQYNGYEHEFQLNLENEKDKNISTRLYHTNSNDIQIIKSELENLIKGMLDDAKLFLVLKSIGFTGNRLEQKDYAITVYWNHIDKKVKITIWKKNKVVLDENYSTSDLNSPLIVKREVEGILENVLSMIEND